MASRIESDSIVGSEGRFYMLVGPNGGCSVFRESGDEVVSMSSWVEGGDGVRGILDGEDWEFAVAGIRRLHILGRPVGEDHAWLGFVGSSTAGVILLGEDQAPYRFRNPILGRSRIENAEGEQLLSVRARYFPRFRIWFGFLGREGDRSAVVPFLGVFACLTVISVARPSLHWTTLFSGAPAGAIRQLRAAMRGELPPGGALRAVSR
jgi:hypothetical protein